MAASSGMHFRGIFSAASLVFICSIWIVSCRNQEDRKDDGQDLHDRFALVLGVTQDAGYPQIGCHKSCCLAFRNGEETRRLVTSIALVDRRRDRYWLLEATPDVGEQLHRVSSFLGRDSFRLPAGVLLTHAHIGHYAGLMQFGREAFGARELPVYAMPRMRGFLQSNGPWSQLVETRNITLRNLQSDSTVDLGGSFRITPFRVPHRDEYSETVGFVVEGDRRIVFLPDIDKWERWDRELFSIHADAYLIDGTFMDAHELPGRDMREIPHPFVAESMGRFGKLPDSIRSKVVFIHFNHTNPLIRKASKARDSVVSKGFRIAEEGGIIPL